MCQTRAGTAGSGHGAGHAGGPGLVPEQVGAGQEIAFYSSEILNMQERDGFIPGHNCRGPYKKDDYRRKGKCCRFCLRGRIYSIPCHASYFEE